MNGETAKLLRKASKNRRHYNRLKRQWNKMSRPEKESARKELIEQLMEFEDVHVPDAWKEKANAES
jgi:hypothetical protein